MSWFDRMKAGLSKSREKFQESINVLTFSGPDVDDDFWDNLEETLIMSDMGARAATKIVEEMKDTTQRKALANADAIMDVLCDRIADTFTVAKDGEGLDQDPLCLLLVGVNGSGKTTTAGKMAAEAKGNGKTVVLGAADTFRAAAIEQLEEWARRSDVTIVERERGSDPASVCYETLEVAEREGADLVVVDTAGRLHTSADLMRELQKVTSVVRKRAACPVMTVLVIDATTGQNGLVQARTFNDALDLDGVIVTKLDGTAKGGIALAISYELGLPILKIGVGEGIEDLRDFDAHDFARALTGSEE
ncbi:signal recognition particle-docking protein FtsY [Slackia heliotrinireducens]|uniref:Signal recognition particle receptor FtsY n=1 Tax=Slackia heliotrinireducens (strain ATCC 29202 / DSM 20476 / NCTC 11029 / RHS 1) TaxID=471855 RepID=C7N561_SLAHD|nr:signal recognition particle-docking protein FtsY [Slackia heliotrinireducens]ACV22046.1 signal recognition particle-docking protein FtsY [Slackia heliotrinireducens DSM 20476]VEG99995.1 Cell division protein FtsY homolog [Slackia heliotrinireducens]